jgi:DNA-nicking Smr family endonuclease
MNKYQKIPEMIVDLHGHTVAEAKAALSCILKGGECSHVRIITGKGTFRANGPVLRDFVKEYLDERNISWRYAKIKDGGDGAIEVSF